MNQTNSNPFSKSVTGILKGEDLSAFLKLQTEEGISQSATFALIVSDWRRLTANQPANSRYATINPEAFNLALGEIAQLSRRIVASLNALRSPRPVLPEDQATWRKMWDQASAAFASVDPIVGRLFETGKLIETKAPDRGAALSLARWSYSWTGARAALYQEVLFSVLKPWVGEVPVPTPPSPTKLPSQQDHVV